MLEIIGCSPQFGVKRKRGKEIFGPFDRCSVLLIEENENALKNIGVILNDSTDDRFLFHFHFLI